MLADGADVDLRVVASGTEAMDYLLGAGRFADRSAAPAPDLVLLDLNMPLMDGREVLRRIRSHPDLQHLVVVVLTTSDHQRDVMEAYRLNCNSFITKPVSMDRFVPAIRELSRYWFELATVPRGA